MSLDSDAKQSSNAPEFHNSAEETNELLNSLAALIAIRSGGTPATGRTRVQSTLRVTSSQIKPDFDFIRATVPGITSLRPVLYPNGPTRDTVKLLWLGEFIELEALDQVLTLSASLNCSEGYGGLFAFLIGSSLLADLQVDLSFRTSERDLEKEYPRSTWTGAIHKGSITLNSTNDAARRVDWTSLAAASLLRREFDRLEEDQDQSAEIEVARSSALESLLEQMAPKSGACGVTLVKDLGARLRIRVWHADDFGSHLAFALHASEVFSKWLGD